MSIVRVPQARAGLVERPDRRPGQEDPAAARRDDEAGHRRIAVADGDDQVCDLPSGSPFASSTGRPMA